MKCKLCHSFFEIDEERTELTLPLDTKKPTSAVVDSLVEDFKKPANPTMLLLPKSLVLWIL